MDTINRRRFIEGATDAGAVMAPTNLESHHREVGLPKAKTLKKTLVHKA